MGFLNIKKWGKKSKAAKEATAETSSPPAPMRLPPRPPAMSNMAPRSQSTGSLRNSNGDSDDEGRASNPRTLMHSTSLIGLDTMMEELRTEGNLPSNMVHMEVPFGKPIEEVYDGVHFGPVLGSGISGLVRLVTHKATGLKYAVKVLDLGLVQDTEGLVQLREEIFIMCQLDHPNIVRLEEVYESQSEIYLVQELCLGGELFDRLDEQPDYHYTEAECARLVKQMLSAVRYLHSKGIIHRDLKLENFLFSGTAKDSELKMIDFGLSKHFRYGEVQHEAVGTPYTVSPEVIRGSYDERCDVWAIGVITFLLLSGDPPFGGCGGPEPLLQVRANILKGAFSFEPGYIWANVSEAGKSFISQLLKPDPQDRPTAEDAQQHEWLKKSAACTNNVLNPNVVKALVNFKEYSDMRKLLCEVLSFTLLPYQIKELRSEFEKMDTDGSGEISFAALKQVLMTNAGAGSLGALTEEEVEDIFNAMRVSKAEARIHWHEFIAAGLSQCQVDDRNLRLAFDRLDGDHKGYIILDDIMDLMGNGLSEEDMERMWGDSVKAVKGQHARITYDDFLLLMKGQTTDTPAQEVDSKVVAMDLSKPLPVVTEISEIWSDTSPATSADEMEKPHPLSNGNFLNEVGTLTLSGEDLAFPPPAPFDSHSAPATPTNSRRTLEMPISIDSEDDDGIVSSGPGVPGTSASLTPPVSPSRGPEDYVTPAGHGRICLEFKDPRKSGMYLPSLPNSAIVSSKPLAPYTRRRSRSMDDEEKEKDAAGLKVVASAVHHHMLPETENSRNHVGSLAKDESKTNLVVNRALYRAHRQMRLAVLDASKRFEEQQARHAEEVILAAHEKSEDVDGTGRMIQAGLVMRRGHQKQVSSQSIRRFLESNRKQQQQMVEVATRCGGRGRRSRNKTISDISAMLTSTGADDLGSVVQQAQAPQATAEPVAALLPRPNGATGGAVGGSGDPTNPDNYLNDFSERGTLRNPTVPGEFRKSADPFGKQGKYGAIVSQWNST